ncbi:hypothetical protein M011DRAFT_469883 [Sporormia fimetaria CBS 119925]|uniref:Uncharacterized protein n=1 Tax=Sporormia fimetaria CBS 119925 TaxID=1340428 RepID=A0A6A6V3M6_9PLEO|nr:hypothetical protein M011DRAFT_469883 [Sporormia fimetaria CBS 119925]
MAVGKYQPLTLTPINFSLTEGTSIPAPPESPPETPRPPTPGKGPLDSHPTPGSRHGTPDRSPTQQLHKTPSTEEHNGNLSPTSPNGKRPGSVRKFLGLRPLSSSDSLRSDRPGSPNTVDKQPGLARKKSTSWFNRRKSSFGMGPVLENNQAQASSSNGVRSTERVTPQKTPEKKGPPPPTLPSLSVFGVTEETTSLGADDMFKNIK